MTLRHTMQAYVGIPYTIISITDQAHNLFCVLWQNFRVLSLFSP